MSGERDTALTAAARALLRRASSAAGSRRTRCARTAGGGRRSLPAPTVRVADGSKTLELLVAAARDRDAVRRGPTSLKAVAVPHRGLRSRTRYAAARCRSPRHSSIAAPPAPAF